MLMRTVRICLLMFASAVGCGSGTDSPASEERAAVPADLTRYCRGICERSGACVPDADSSVGDCEQECEQHDVYVHLLRADVLDALHACAVDSPCDGRASCTERVLAELVPDYENSPLLARCHEIYDACGDISDDACEDVPIFTSSAKAELDVCLRSTCPASGDCLDALLYPGGK